MSFQDIRAALVGAEHRDVYLNDAEFHFWIDATAHLLDEMVSTRAARGRGAIVDRQRQVDLLTHSTPEQLHRRRQHPGWEYATTETARKSGESRQPEGEGWEPNNIVECGWETLPNGTLDLSSPIRWRNWERFDFHEEEYWKRRKPYPKESGESPIR